MTTAATQRLLRLDEAARRCAYSISSLRRAIRRGELAAVRLGPTERHPLRIPEDELGRWIYSDQMSAAGLSVSRSPAGPAARDGESVSTSTAEPSARAGQQAATDHKENA